MNTTVHILADDFALTHKKSGFIYKRYAVKSNWSGRNGGKPHGKPINKNKRHLRRLPMISLTKVKLSKVFLNSGKDQCVITTRNLVI